MKENSMKSKFDESKPKASRRFSLARFFCKKTIIGVIGAMKSTYLDRRNVT